MRGECYLQGTVEEPEKETWEVRDSRKVRYYPDDTVNLGWNTEKIPGELKLAVTWTIVKATTQYWSENSHIKAMENAKHTINEANFHERSKKAGMIRWGRWSIKNFANNGTLMLQRSGLFTDQNLFWKIRIRKFTEILRLKRIAQTRSKDPTEFYSTKRKRKRNGWLRRFSRIQNKK